MATYTKNLGLKMPEADDAYAIGDFNGNTERIDEELACRVVKADGTKAGTFRRVTVNADGLVVGGESEVLAVEDGGTGRTEFEPFDLLCGNYSGGLTQIEHATHPMGSVLMQGNSGPAYWSSTIRMDQVSGLANRLSGIEGRLAHVGLYMGSGEGEQIFFSDVENAVGLLIFAIGLPPVSEEVTDGVLTRTLRSGFVCKKPAEEQGTMQATCGEAGATMLTLFADGFGKQNAAVTTDGENPLYLCGGEVDTGEYTSVTLKSELDTPGVLYGYVLFA